MYIYIYIQNYFRLAYFIHFCFLKIFLLLFFLSFRNVIPFSRSAFFVHLNNLRCFEIMNRSYKFACFTSFLLWSALLDGQRFSINFAPVFSFLLPLFIYLFFLLLLGRKNYEDTVKLLRGWKLTTDKSADEKKKNGRTNRITVQELNVQIWQDDLSA